MALYSLKCIRTVIICFLLYFVIYYILFVFLEILGLQRPSFTFTQELSVKEHPKIPSRPASSAGICDSCETSQKEVTYFKSLISHLQKKLDNLESSHETAKRTHTEASEALRQRIIELELGQEKIYTQLTTECKSKGKYGNNFINLFKHFLHSSIGIGSRAPKATTTHGGHCRRKGSGN